MVLTNRKEEQVSDMPIIRTTVGKSKDGKWLITRTTFTYIQPIGKVQAIIDRVGYDEVDS